MYAYRFGSFLPITLDETLALGSLPGSRTSNDPDNWDFFALKGFNVHGGHVTQLDFDG